MAVYKAIKVFKDRFRVGYYSIHDVEYRDGKLVHDVMLGYFRDKRRAKKAAAEFRKRRARGEKLLPHGWPKSR
jgi:hypothetical protein